MPSLKKVEYEAHIHHFSALPITRKTQKILATFLLLAIIAWIINSGMKILSGHEIPLSVLTDINGTESIHSVTSAEREKDFIALPHGFSRGYTRNVHWIKFILSPVDNNYSIDESFFLEIQPPYLDKIDIYWPDTTQPNGFYVYHAGDTLPATQKEYRYRAFLHKLKFTNQEPHTAYLRLETSSSSILFLRAWSQEDAFIAIQLEHLWIGLFYGLILSSLLANWWSGLWRIYKLHLAYLIYISATLCVLVFNAGTHNLIWPQLNPIIGNYAVSIFTLLLTTASTYFYKHALEYETAPIWFKIINKSTIYASILAIPFIFFELYTEIIRINFTLVVFSLSANLIRIKQLHNKKHPGVSLLFLAHILSLNGYFFSTLTLTGIVPYQAWLLYGYQAALLGTFCALQVMLIQRIRLIEKAQERSRIAIARTQAEAEQAAREREQQRRFLAMLTHELRTPLSVLKLYMGLSNASDTMRKHAESSIHAINELVERCGLVSSIDEQKVPLNIQKIYLPDIINEVITQSKSPQRVINNIALDVFLQNDSLLLSIVLKNLIDNAIKYMPAQACVSLYATVTFTSDNRHGISLKFCNPVGVAGFPDARYLFDKYYRAPAAKSLAGSGLGLYIVKELCTLMDVEIHYQPTSTEVCFLLWIPITLNLLTMQ